mmetsp:Transcript_4329/g.5636  ORF Transcript_4329/g.5636 Transcript_4329/m.5636 type:complete len:236 (-) Transcript_4329:274-981(-)
MTHRIPAAATVRSIRFVTSSQARSLSTTANQRRTFSYLSSSKSCISNSLPTIDTDSAVVGRRGTTTNFPSSTTQRSFVSTTTPLSDENNGTSDGNAAVTTKASPKVEALFQKIIWLDLFELHLLMALINEKMGMNFSAADLARGGGGGKKSGADSAQEEEEKVEKTAFDLKLMAFDAKAKIKIIKEVRAITSLGLKEAKELVEGAPKVLKKEIKMEEAEELKKKLEELGATIEIE